MEVLLTMLPLLFSNLFSSSAITAAQENGRLQTLYIPAPATGPESIAFDRIRGGPYIGVSDGHILKWEGGRDGGWTVFAAPAQRQDLPAFINSQSLFREIESILKVNIHEQFCRWEGCSSSSINLESLCGRPLGLQFNKVTGELYIADAYFGLLGVGPEGGAAQQLAMEANGVPFSFTNGVDVDEQTGIVYFTDSSIHFQRCDQMASDLRPKTVAKANLIEKPQNHHKEYQMLVASGDATGRLMKYDPASREVTVLLAGLTFPNGIALSDDQSFALVASTTDCKVSRYWLKGPKAGEFELFAELPGYPDNIKRNDKGEFWVGINREKIRLDGSLVSAGVAPAAIKLSGDGRVLEVLDARIMSPLSEVLETNGTFWLGSVDLPFLGVLFK
ncbi:Strictosidine synthase 1 [Apostasia shenzhenica]|uniref:Strictosidine synthase 1 n=1 Tax=Apostasia shenzhenica TaxID=1088818 RepID=A0A2I0BHM2_9ASPA|nr:Strictosidine synthase 1 [Apostasia shenzhenica]